MIMKNILSFALLAIFSLMLTVSCKPKHDRPPYQLDNPNTATISIPYEELGGVKTIPVKLNGVTMNMILDTGNGASGVHLSLNEVKTLAKNGVLKAEDILDAKYTNIADGSIVENGRLNIRELRIGEEDGIVLHNIEATVALNQNAPILLGNEVLDQFASFEIDNVNKKINFYKK